MYLNNINKLIKKIFEQNIIRKINEDHKKLRIGHLKENTNKDI